MMTLQEAQQQLEPDLQSSLMTNSLVADERTTHNLLSDDKPKGSIAQNIYNKSIGNLKKLTASASILPQQQRETDSSRVL